MTEANLQNRLDNGDGSEGDADGPSAEERKNQLAETDYTLYESLNLLKGLIIVGNRS